MIESSIERQMSVCHIKLCFKGHEIGQVLEPDLHRLHQFRSAQH